MLDPQEIEQLRERNDKQSLRIATEKLNLEKQLQLKKDKLQRDFDAYASVISEEIKKLQVERNVLSNEIRQLENLKQAGLEEVYIARASAQEILLQADKRVKDAEIVETIVENKMDKLKKRGDNLKKLLSTSK